MLLVSPEIQRSLFLAQVYWTLCWIQRAHSDVSAFVTEDVFSESSSSVEQRDSEFLTLLIFTCFIDFIQVRG